MSDTKSRNRISKSRVIDNGQANATQNEKAHQSSNNSIMETLLEFDKAVTRSLGVCASPNSVLGSWRPLMKFLEHSCHGIWWIGGTVLATLMSHQVSMQHKLLNLLAALLLDCVIVGLFKVIFRRKRPSHNTDDMFMAPSVDKFAFPSGHTTRAAMLACFFTVHFSYGLMSDWAFTMWAFVVGMSRIMLGRHHVSDVFSGLIIGVATYKLMETLWLSDETCHSILTPIHEHTHL